MNKIIKFLLPVFLFVWEFPQNLLGLIVYGFMIRYRRIIKVEFEKHSYFIETKNTGVSLGWMIFWTVNGNRFTHLVNDCRMHEYGHARQSVLLGPFYLVVVGIPSLSRVLYSRWYMKKHGRRWENYFNGFPENWADKLGGVVKS